MAPELTSYFGQQATVWDRRIRSCFGLYLLILSAITLLICCQRDRDLDPWTLGDWLINYSAGFVRRGLIGEIALFATRWSPQSSVRIIFMLQAVCFISFIACVYRLTRNLHWDFALSTLLLSPAAFSFFLMNEEEDLRKEVLLFAALALLSMPRIHNQRAWRLSAALTLLISVVVLSHEALTVYLPYLFAMLLLHRGLRATILICSVPAVAAIGAVLAVVTHTGNLSMAQTICSSIGGHLQPFTITGATERCGGAISWLQVAVGQSHLLIWPTIRDLHTFRTFALLIPVSVGPAILCLVKLWRAGLQSQVRQISTVAVLSSMASVSLYYTSIDWGRWIFIHVVCVTLLILACMQRTKHFSLSPRSDRLRPRARISLMVFVFVYASVWRLPVGGSLGGAHSVILSPLVKQSYHYLSNRGTTVRNGY